MASEPITMSTTEQGLRERIHRIFADDASLVERPPDRPHFWVEPTEAQKGTRVLEIHERIQITDEVGIHDPTAEEQSWLAAPHAGLGGRSPKEMLTGDEHSRAVLNNFIAVFEQGSFT